MLRGFPLLKGLELNGTRIGNVNSRLTGNISSLQVLKETIEKVRIFGRHRVEGDLMDLADFPRLKKLNLFCTNVTGDIRNIRRHDFPALEQLFLPMTVCGGVAYEFQSILDVPSFMQAVHLLLQRTPTLFGKNLLPRAFCWCLSERSPHWYNYDETNGCPRPPFDLQFIQVGKRLGWSWFSSSSSSGDPWNAGEEGLLFSCEINWLDPEPSRESGDYEAYMEELQSIQRRSDFYRGFLVPPNMLEYRRLCEGGLR